MYVLRLKSVDAKLLVINNACMFLQYVHFLVLLLCITPYCIFISSPKGIAGGTVGTFLPLVVYVAMTLAMCPNVLAGKSYKSENDAEEEAREKKRSSIDRVYPVEAYKNDENELSGDEIHDVKEAKDTHGKVDGDCSIEELDWRIGHLSKSLDELKRIAATLKAQKSAPVPEA